MNWLQVNELLQASLAPFACEKLGRLARRPGTSLDGSLVPSDSCVHIALLQRCITGVSVEGRACLRLYEPRHGQSLRISRALAQL